MKIGDILKCRCNAENWLWDCENGGYLETEPTIKVINSIKVEMFAKGVKYANRWIDVSDKRPNLQQLVLVKYQTDEVALATYIGGLHGSTMFKQKCEDSTFGTRVVQWKPI